MNELVVKPDNKNRPHHPLPDLLNNRFILFVPIIFLLFNSKKGGESLGASKGVESLSTFISSFLEKNKDVFTLENINRKVNILKKVGPYMPEPTIEILNKVILNFEKISKGIALMEFISTNKSYEPIVAVKTVNQKDKINKIFKALEDEIPKDQARTIKPIMDIVVNFDKYKSMISMVASLANPSANSTPKLEDMIDLVVPLLGGEEAAQGEGEGKKKSDQIKDMLQMFELLTMLNSSEKKEKKESEENEESSK